MSTFTREDFEHAARAGGIPIQGWFKTTSHDGTESLAVVTAREHAGSRELGTMHVWCPPIDDGDALRLAVALETFNLMHVLSMHGDPELYKADRAKAIRYAIFREAIRQGREMVATSAAHEAAASIEHAFAVDAPGLSPKTFSGIATPGETAQDQQLETLKTDQPTTNTP